jgi:hypothetical protein
VSVLDAAMRQPGTIRHAGEPVVGSEWVIGSESAVGSEPIVGSEGPKEQGR